MAWNETSPTQYDALGESEVFLQFQEQLSKVAQVDRPVLIVGERGTGKELAVSRLHYLSSRWQGGLVALNCSALSPNVLESELFGHEAGAFTGAVKRRQGRFEAADGGSLFLDEIGLIPIPVQEKILRVVEYGTFERVGGSQSVRVDVRIIGATNADLPALAREGKIKRDLLDRLSFEVLFLPALRQRKEDIMLLARHFSARMANELGRPGIPEFSDEAMEALETHSWPGNIRELKNVVERAVYANESGLIRQVNFDPFKSPWDEERLDEHPVAGEESRASSLPAEGPELGNRTLPEAIRELELTALKSALEGNQFHQGKAAERLGLTYHQFRGLYRKYAEELS